MPSTTIRTHGNSRPYEYRPSDHRAGMREYWFGRIEPMQEQRPSIWRRIMGRG